MFVVDHVSHDNYFMRTEDHVVAPQSGLTLLFLAVKDGDLGDRQVQDVLTILLETSSFIQGKPCPFIRINKTRDHYLRSI